MGTNSFSQTNRNKSIQTADVLVIACCYNCELHIRVVRIVVPFFPPMVHKPDDASYIEL